MISIISVKKRLFAAVSGEFTVKRLDMRPNSPIRLLPENPNYAPITITPELDAEFFGVVTHCLKNLR